MLLKLISYVASIYILSYEKQLITHYLCHVMTISSIYIANARRLIVMGILIYDMHTYKLQDFVITTSITFTYPRKF